MNKQLLILTLITFASGSCFAENLEKSATHIDFNKMIEQNDTTNLQKDLTTHENTEANQTASDNKKVLDFVDVEIGMGPERPVADRRFNSVGEIRVASEYTVTLQKKGEK